MCGLSVYCYSGKDKGKLDAYPCPSMSRFGCMEDRQEPVIGEYPGGAGSTLFIG